MASRSARDRCNRIISWLPVGVCLLLVGWSYSVFVFSVCGYLFEHAKTLQGLMFLALIHVIVVLLLWSFFLASFTSPGYPSEIMETMHGRSKRSLYDADSINDDVHVGLLEHGQFSLTHSPISAASSSARPLYPHFQGAVSGDVSGGFGGGEGGGGESAAMGHLESPFDHGHRVSDVWNQHYRPSSTSSVRQSLLQPHPHPPPPSPLPFASPSSLSSNSHNTVINMMTADDCTDTTTLRNASVEVDDNTPLGMVTQRFTVKRDGSVRYCQKCNFEKPDRTHHCSSCRRCVLKMDHHCPWLNNCVGLKNHKAFYLFVLWTAIYCVALVACTIPVAADAFSRPYEATFTQAHWVFLILAGIIFGLCLVPFAIHHTLLLRQNKTTIESFEKHKYRMGSTGEVLQSRMLNVFDVGTKKNFVQVLGPVWYLWLVPVRNSLGDGWSFPANEYGKNLLRSTQQDVCSGQSTLVSMPLVSSSFKHNDISHHPQQQLPHHHHHQRDFYDSSHQSLSTGMHASVAAASATMRAGTVGDGIGVGRGGGVGGNARGFYAMGAGQGLPLRSDAASPAFSFTTSSSSTTSASELPELQSASNHNANSNNQYDSDPDENAYHRRDSDSDLDDHPRFRPRTTRRKFYRRYQGYMYNGTKSTTSPLAKFSASNPAGAGSGIDDDSGDEDDDEHDIEPEEYIYDSDEQATIRFTER